MKIYLKKTLLIILFLISSVTYAEYELDEFIDALSKIESNHNQNAFNEKEKARGILQIRPILVKDINRILGSKIYNPKDVYSPFTSRQIAKIYLNYYGSLYEKKYNKKITFEVLARIWNGGPSGYKKWQTKKYWLKVKKVFV